MAWLRTEMEALDKSLVSTLWCVVCRKYETRICGLKNFSRAWIDGSVNHKTSNVTDHANSEQHKSAMTCFRKDQAKCRNEPITSYSPIARSLLSSAIDPAVRERVKKKFDISFVLAKELYRSRNIQLSIILYLTSCLYSSIIIVKEMSGQHSVVARYIVV